MKTIIFKTTLLLLLFAGCSYSTVKVERAEQGKNLGRAKPCDAETAFFELMTHPKISLSKTNTGYCDILYDDSTSIYWGYLKIDNWLNRVVNPLYKTSKSDYEEVVRKSNGMNIFLVYAIISKWFDENYPEYRSDTIRTANWKQKVGFVENSNNLYNTRVAGEYEYYYQRMEKSDDPKIDSTMNYYTIKKYTYDCLIGDDKEIIDMKQLLTYE